MLVLDNNELMNLADTYNTIKMDLFDKNNLHTLLNNYMKSNRYSDNLIYNEHIRIELNDDWFEYYDDINGQPLVDCKMVINDLEVEYTYNFDDIISINNLDDEEFENYLIKAIL